MAELERLRPIRATVGPIITGGISLFIQSDPANLMTIAIIVYTSPANTAPRITPQYPKATPVANGIINAKEDPRNTGLLNLVNNR